MAMEHFNCIFFHKSGHAHKQHTYQSISVFIYSGAGSLEYNSFSERVSYVYWSFTKSICLLDIKERWESLLPRREEHN